MSVLRFFLLALVCIFYLCVCRVMNHAQSQHPQLMAVLICLESRPEFLSSNQNHDPCYITMAGVTAQAQRLKCACRTALYLGS